MNVVATLVDLSTDERKNPKVVIEVPNRKTSKNNMIGLERKNLELILYTMTVIVIDARVIGTRYVISQLSQ